jgi:hypothetical protein
MFSRLAPQRKYEKTNSKLGINLFVFLKLQPGMFSDDIQIFVVSYTSIYIIITYPTCLTFPANELCNINKKVFPNLKAAYFWV